MFGHPANASSIDEVCSYFCLHSCLHTLRAPTLHLRHQVHGYGILPNHLRCSCLSHARLLELWPADTCMFGQTAVCACGCEHHRNAWGAVLKKWRGGVTQRRAQVTRLLKPSRHHRLVAPVHDVDSARAERVVFDHVCCPVP